uniref:Uncharacterized protein n=1 Tax=Parascaris equorum TaxID=6256 RepID=A0A914R8D2_PAREQ
LQRYRSIDPDNQLLDTSDSTEDHLQWETIRERVIRAGSIEKLVVRYFSFNEIVRILYSGRLLDVTFSSK